MRGWPSEHPEHAAADARPVIRSRFAAADQVGDAADERFELLERRRPIVSSRG